MPVHVIEGVEVVVNRSFRNEGDSICERIINFMNEDYQENEEKEKMIKKGA